MIPCLSQEFILGKPAHLSQTIPNLIFPLRFP